MIDKQTFTAQVEARAQMLYRVARTILPRDEDCRDALQECALRAWAARHTLREPQYFGTWITRILIRECHTLRRRQAKYHLQAEVEPAQAAAPAPDPDLQAALMALPEKLRLPLVLHHVEGYAIGELAAILRLPASTVRGRLFQARKALRIELTDPEEKEAWPHEA